MKLNLDTIRTLLLYLEENLIVSENGFEEIDYTQISEDTNIAIPETINTLVVLDEAGFIQTNYEYGNDSFDELSVSRITYDGYQFLESVRPEPIFKKVLNLSKTIGMTNLPLIAKTCISLSEAAVRSKLGI